MITCNLKNVRLQITSDYMKKSNRLQLITITSCLVMIGTDCIGSYQLEELFDIYFTNKLKEHISSV